MQVEYFQKLNPATTVLHTARIDRFRRSFDIDVEPCTEYTFKVIYCVLLAEIFYKHQTRQIYRSRIHWMLELWLSFEHKQTMILPKLYSTYFPNILG